MSINKTKIVDTLGAGKGLAAASDLEVGDVIIEIKDPYILVVEKACLDKVCSECLLETDKLKRCARCKVAQYCSATCQKTAWTSIHKLECSALARMPGVPPTPVRALNPRWRDLKPNQEHLSKSSRYPDIILQARAACEYANFSAPKALEFAAGILCRMSTNAFRATATGGDPVGLCFEPILALANHSCSPNAAIVFSGRSIMLRALDPIKDGDEVLISYVDGTQRLKIRQAELREAYFFDCKCEKCVKDETPYQLWLRSRHQVRSLPLSLSRRNHKLDLFQGARFQSLANVATRDVYDKMSTTISDTQQSHFLVAETQLQVARDTSDNALRLASISKAFTTLRSFRDSDLFALPPYPTILHELYLYYVDSQAFGIALSLLLFMQLNCYFYSYPQPNHPSNIERVFTIAKLCGTMISSPTSKEVEFLHAVALGPKLKKAISSIDWMSAAHALLIIVADLVPLSHGVNARFTLEAAKMLDDIEEAQMSRPDSTSALLKQWRTGGEEGTLYALEVFERLRILGDKEVAKEIMDMGLV